MFYTRTYLKIEGEKRQGKILVTRKIIGGDYQYVMWCGMPFRIPVV